MCVVLLVCGVGYSIAWSRSICDPTTTGSPHSSQRNPDSCPSLPSPPLRALSRGRLLTPVSDRLEVRPSFTEVFNMGRKPQQAAGTKGVVVKSDRSQGFTMHMRLRGGPGRRLFRRLINLSGHKSTPTGPHGEPGVAASGVKQVLSCFEYGRKGLLRIKL